MSARLRDWSARLARYTVPYACLVALRGLDALYILQLERYKPDRYRLWLASHRAALVSRREVAVQCLTVIVAVGTVEGPRLPKVTRYVRDDADMVCRVLVTRCADPRGHSTFPRQGAGLCGCAARN